MSGILFLAFLFTAASCQRSSGTVPNYCL